MIFFSIFCTQKRCGCETYPITTGIQNLCNERTVTNLKPGQLFNYRICSYACVLPDASLMGSQCKSSSLSLIHPHRPLSKLQLCTSTPRQNRAGRQKKEVLIPLAEELQQLPLWLTLAHKHENKMQQKEHQKKNM